jgi:protein-L-isoaspartate O-methyltransferase
VSPSDPSFGTNPLCVSSSMMEESPRYGEWMADVIRSHLRGHVLEVGCGNGHYTAHYAALPGVERITQST